MASWIDELERKHVEIEGGLSQWLPFDQSRGKAHHNIMIMIQCCENYPDEITSFGMSTLTRWLETSVPGRGFKGDMENVLVDLWSIASNEELNYPFTGFGRRVAPVEFVFIGASIPYHGTRDAMGIDYQQECCSTCYETMISQRRLVPSTPCGVA